MIFIKITLLLLISFFIIGTVAIGLMMHKELKQQNLFNQLK